MIYNPLDKYYKSIIGAISADQKLTLRVKGNFDSVVFVLRKDGFDNSNLYSMVKIDDCFSIDINLTTGLYFYYFIVNDNVFISNDNLMGVLSDEINEFQLTVYDSRYTVPDWIYGGVIYQIFPDRFNRASVNNKIKKGKILHNDWNEQPVYLPNEQGKILNNDFFGGDIKGIIEKLDYLAEMGVNAIYLNPIFEAYSNHRYDTGDYMKVDELLGSETDLISLIDNAKKKGIKIILDGVFNHTGDDSLYFNKHGNYNSVGAYQDKNSKYYNWYSFITYPDKYEAWWGIETLPAINESNDQFVDFITGKNGVLEHYTKLGIAGWRLDVVDELPSTFVKKIRSCVKGCNSNAIVIGEVWEDVSNKISYGVRREYLQGKELDSAMNYPLKNAIIDFVKCKNSNILSCVIKEQIDHYPKIALHAMMNILSTHDTMRILTVFGGEDPISMTKKQMAEYLIPAHMLSDAIFKLKVATLLQFTLCGVPCIYYGDEIGMQGYGDPLNRATFKWQEQNLEIKNWYKLISNIRASYSVFKCGDFEEVYSSLGIYCFKRTDEDCEVFVGINLNDDEIYFDFEGELVDLIENTKHIDQIELKGKSMCVLIKNS